MLSPEAAEKLQSLIGTTYTQNQARIQHVLIEEHLKQQHLLHPSKVSWVALPPLPEEPEQVLPLLIGTQHLHLTLLSDAIKLLM